MEKCNPGNTCDMNTNSARLATRCVANHVVSADPGTNGDYSLLLPALGGSATVSVVTAGFSNTVCKYNDSSVFVTYSLWASHMMPTYLPTQQPTLLTPLGSTGGAAGSGIYRVITSTGAPFYIVAAVAGLLAVLSIYLAQAKANKLYRDKVHEMSLFASIIPMALIGSSLTSECFLMSAMFAAQSTAKLGIVVLVARLLHLPAAMYLLSKMFVRSNSGQPPALADLLEQDMILQGTKVWGVVALVCVMDATVLRYFPWLESDFAVKSDGYPNATVFLVCVGTKLGQAVLTMACQISYFVIVNAEADLDSMAASFLILNMATTILLCLLNGAEFVMKRGILLSGTLKTASSTAAASPNVPPRPTFSIAPPSLRLPRLSLFIRPSDAAATNHVIADIEIQPLPFLSGSKNNDTIPLPNSESADTTYISRGSTLPSTLNPLVAARLSADPVASNHIAANHPTRSSTRLDPNL